MLLKTDVRRALDRRWFGALLPLIFVAACSGSDGSTGSGGSAGTGSDGAAGTGGAAGVGGSGPGADAGTDSDAAGSALGFFTVQAYLPALGASGSGSVIAVFQKAIPAPPQPNCMRRNLAGCLIDECSSSGTSDGGSPMTSPHAGTLTLTGTGVDVMVSIQPDSLGQYPVGTPPGSGTRFTGAEAAKLVATGGQVPAFTIDTTYPLLFLLNQPTTTMGRFTAPRTQDLTLAWSRGTPDGIFYLQGSSGRPMGSIYVQCRITASNGSLTLPATELSKFNAGTTFLLASFTKATARAGAYEVNFYLGGEVITPDRMNVVEITLQ